MTDKEPEIFLRPGQLVRVEGVRTMGEIINGPDNRDHFTVAIGQLTMNVPRSKLKPLSTEELKKKAKKAKQQAKSRTPHARSAETPLEIDLHGFSVDAAIEAVDKAIDQALLAGCDQLVIVHGKGTGALKDAIHKYLSASRFVRHYKIEDLNPGTTRAYL